MYVVQNPDGTQAGPVDLPTLEAWAGRGMLRPDAIVRDAFSGVARPASQIPNLRRAAGARWGGARRRRPYAINTGPAMALLVICPALLFGVTLPKLHRMRIIKGLEPGGRVETAIVTAKGSEPGKAEMRYYVNFDMERALQNGIEDRGTTWVEAQEWSRLHRGDRIELVTPPGETMSYYRNGVYVSDGNFQFDRVLAALTSLAFVAALVSIAVNVLYARASAAPAPSGRMPGPTRAQRPPSGRSW